MTADIRTAAQRTGIVPSSRAEAEEKYAGFGTYKHAKVDSFVDGAVWGAARVTPTDEQIAEAVHAHNLDELLVGNGSEWLWYTAACSCGWRSEQYEYPGDAHKIYAAHVAANVSKLLAGLAEEEKND